MGSKLDPVLREVAILRTGYLSHAAYETWQHEASARLLKMTDAQIDANKTGGQHPGVLNAQQQAVLDFTDDVVKNVRAGDAALAGVRRYLNDTDTVDLILVIGAYMTVSRLLETTGVPMEDKPIDWAAMNKSMKEAQAKAPANAGTKHPGQE
jgi:alkylhydroperoxidase family enzyme